MYRFPAAFVTDGPASDLNKAMFLSPKTIISAAAAFLVLTMAAGAIHGALFELLPQEGYLGKAAGIFLLVLALLPAIITGGMAGYMSRRRGIANGVISVFIAAIALYGFLGSDDWSQQAVSIIVAGLAGGCGELFALRRDA